MFHSVSLFSQAPFALGSRALPNVLFLPVFVSMQDADSFTQGYLVWLCGHLYDPGGEWSFPQHTRLPGKNNACNTVYCSYTVFGLLTHVQQGVTTGLLKETESATNKHNYYLYVRL